MSYTNNKTNAGNAYRSYIETVNNDKVRAFVPAKLNDKPVVVWLIHGYGSSHDAILGGYLALAQGIVDSGNIAVCPNLGGSLWSSPKAQTHLKNAATKLASILNRPIAGNVMVGTSHGGCLAIYATGKKLLPNILGLYVVNGVYDPQSTKGSYGSMMPASYKLAGGTSATNPKNIPAADFTVPVRLVYDETDPTVNADANSKLFLKRLKDAGAEVSTRVHNSEHSTPGGTPKDFATWGVKLL